MITLSKQINIDKSLKNSEKNEWGSMKGHEINRLKKRIVDKKIKFGKVAKEQTFKK